MKKIKFIKTLLFSILVTIGTSLSAQDFKKLDKSPLDIAAYPSNYRESNKELKIIYSRPQLKGRTLSKLAPNGEIWRTGANEAPELILYKDFYFNGINLKAGSYALLTIPGEKEWTIILHSELNAWGSYFYNKENDIARISVPVKTTSDSLEAFSIAFEEDDKNIIMHMGWDSIRVAVPFKKVQ